MPAYETPDLPTDELPASPEGANSPHYGHDGIAVRCSAYVVTQSGMSPVQNLKVGRRFAAMTTNTAHSAVSARIIIPSSLAD